ncbi:orotate phosphoribosyltransferase, partial [bacterium]|nr:orotate phosphoribosyltransferase [bacterium]
MSTTTIDRTVELMLKSGALMRGHFKLTSGLHSDEYCQCAKVLERPEVAEELGRMLADLFRNEEVDVVVSPAIGGIVIGHEVARALGVRSLFAERSETGMAFRRGFRIEPSERVLIIEDVVTTGGSVRAVA